MINISAAIVIALGVFLGSSNSATSGPACEVATSIEGLTTSLTKSEITFEIIEGEKAEQLARELEKLFKMPKGSITAKKFMVWKFDNVVMRIFGFKENGCHDGNGYILIKEWVAIKEKLGL